MNRTPNVANLYSATLHPLEVLWVIQRTVTVACQTSRQSFIVFRKLDVGGQIGISEPRGSPGTVGRIAMQALTGDLSEWRKAEQMSKQIAQPDSWSNLKRKTTPD